MCTICIKTILADKQYPDAGMDLFNKLCNYVDKDENVIIDLSNVVSLPSVFLNTSIGKFIDVYGVDLLREKISFANISKSQAERIKDYIIRYGSTK